MRMFTMDEAKLKIIEENPNQDGLDTVRKRLASDIRSVNLGSCPDAFDQLEESYRRIVALDILAALQALPAARHLPSASSDKPLLKEILDAAFAAILNDSSGKIDLSRIKPLLKAVIDNSEDVAVWTQVYEVFNIAAPSPPVYPSPVASLSTTPTTATLAPTPTTATTAAHTRDTAATSVAIRTHSVHDTPWTRSTSSILNSSETRRVVDPILREELGVFRVDTHGLRESFFASVPDLKTTAAAVFDRCREGNEPVFGEDGWHGWPSEAKEADVVSWFEITIPKLEQFAAEFRPADLAHRRKLRAQPRMPLSGSKGRRSMDIGFINDGLECHHESESTGTHHWSQILVPGELKSNPSADVPSEAWLDLATYVREVFAAQDDRRFVLAFTLCGPILRLWEFDRLGGMASEKFNINESEGGLEFVATMLGFLWVDKAGLGFDPRIVSSGDKRFIEIERDGKPERLVIDELIWRARGIACRGTTCWKAYREDDPQRKRLVLKESWQYPERDEEGFIVKEATEKGVINIARHYHHEIVHIGGAKDDVRTSIRNQLDSTPATADAANMTTAATSTMSAITASARKQSTRSSASSTVAAAAMKPSRQRGRRERRQRSVASSDKKTTRVQQLRESRSRDDSSDDDGGSSDSSGTTGTKRRQSEANLDDDNDDDNDNNDATPTAPERPAKRSCSQSAKSSDTERNRIHQLLVYKDYGQPIYKASSRKALLEALESCIQAHKSLRQKANYLHRDISINNLLTREDGPIGQKGLLIDFDLAIKEQRIKNSGAKGKTGTSAFMAIGVLLGKPHSFMHDLESFFWVLFWICVHYVGPGKTRGSKSKFENWNSISDDDLAGVKLMVVYNSEIFCKKAKLAFTQHYAPLIPLMDDLRAAIFPNGHPWEEPKEELYSMMSQILLQNLET
ncbi:hypothetical protein V8C35DRAFT_292804 [Trichoderma chlorosporum]